MSENLSSESRYASGVALVNVVAAGNEAGTVLDAWFPAPALTQTPDLSLADELDALVADHPERNARTEVRTASINLDEAPEDAVDAYLRLHLLCLRWYARTASIWTDCSASWQMWRGRITGRCSPASFRNLRWGFVSSGT